VNAQTAPELQGGAAKARFAVKTLPMAVATKFFVTEHR
jgi:hypothetical protein